MFDLFNSLNLKSKAASFLCVQQVELFYSCQEKIKNLFSWLTITDLLSQISSIGNLTLDFCLNLVYCVFLDYPYDLI